MAFYLLRHGQAAWTSPDEQRSLTPTGQGQVRSNLVARSAQINQPLTLLVSPYRRAQETASIVASVLTVSRQITVDWLTPDSCVDGAIDMLEQIDMEGTTMLVAHNPLLSSLLNRLLGTDSGRHYMGTSALAALELPLIAAGCAQLRWLEAGY